jgi:adenylate cyclase
MCWRAVFTRRPTRFASESSWSMRAPGRISGRNSTIGRSRTFAVQDEIVGKLVTTLGLVLKLEEIDAPYQTGRFHPTTNLEAFDDMLRASQYWFRFSKDDNTRARQWLEKAIQLDPKYAEAYAFLAGAYQGAVLFRWSTDSQADLARASESAQKALALDDSNGMALANLCEIAYLQRRFEQAVAEGERCVATNPNLPACYTTLSDALAVSNEPQGALRAAEKALRLDPTHSDFYGFFIAVPYVLMGRYEGAIPLLKRHIAVYPGQPWAHAALVVAYTELGREADARAEAAEFMRSNPDFVIAGINKDATVNRLWETDLHKAGLK